MCTYLLIHITVPVRVCIVELVQHTPVALKRMYPVANTDRLSEKMSEVLTQFGQEVSIMQQLRHPNIVLLMGVSATRAGDLVMITELMPRGALSDAVRKLCRAL